MHRLGANWDFAANAWSALGAGAAMGLMHALAVRLVPPSAPVSGRARSLAALFPVALLLFNPVWTDVATLAEVYSWHQAWVMAAALVFVGFMRAIAAASAAAGPASSPAGSHRFLARAAGWGFLMGLGFSHHATSVLVAAPFCLVLLIALARARRLGPGLILAAMLSALVPLASYLSLLVKASRPGLEIWFRLQPTWSGLWAHMTGAQYLGYLGGFAADAGHSRFLGLYVHPYLFTTLALLLVLAWRTRDAVERRLVWTLLAVVGIQTVFCFAYGVPDPSSYFLPPLGIALTALVPLGVSFAAIGARPRRLVGVAALAIAVAAAAQSWPHARIAIGRRDVLVALDRDMRKLWRSIPVEHGIVLWGSYRLREYQLLAGERPGLHLIRPIDLTMPVTRARFVARYGFDPFGSRATTPGLVELPTDGGPAYEAFVQRLAVQLHLVTHEPVVLLSPSRDSLRVVEASRPVGREEPPGAPRL